MFTTIAGLILGLLKAIPAARDLFLLVVDRYNDRAIEEHDAKWNEAMTRWHQKRDQSAIEDAAGNPNSGAPSQRREGVRERDRQRGSARLPAICFVALVAATSCATRETIMADVWGADQLPAGLCARIPELEKFGFFRVVHCEKAKQNPRCQGQPPDFEFEEFIPYCDPAAKKYLAMHEDDVAKYIGQATRPRPNP